MSEEIMSREEDSTEKARRSITAVASKRVLAERTDVVDGKLNTIM